MFGPLMQGKVDLIKKRVNLKLMVLVLLVLIRFPVSDPDKTLLRNKSTWIILKTFGTLKKNLERATTDTSLIDYAREDAAGAAERTRAVAD